MLRRSTHLLIAQTLTILQGWGKSSGGGGGWGDSGAGGGGGWGDSGDNSGGGGGGWGDSGDNSGGGGGGWGDSVSNSGGGGGGKGGWGNKGGGRGKSGGGWGKGDGGESGGGWGGGNRSSGGWGESSNNSGDGWGRNRWNDGDSGWKGAPTGARAGRGRGNFRRGRGGGFNDRSRQRGTWGEAPVDEEAWSAAPPSFNPPIRKVDPLTLTAVEVEIDGIKKLVGQRVQISGLSDETSWQTLKDHLRQAGEVTFCKIFFGGRAMVEFTTPQDAARAINELQASELEGSTLFIREDREDTVLLNTRRKIREARDAQLRARKEEAERSRMEAAAAQGDTPDTERSEGKAEETA